MIEFEPGSGAPTPSLPTLARVEDEMNLMLPEDYTAMIRRCNGGIPTTPCFMCDGNERLLERFLCILDDYHDDDEHGMYDVRVVWSQISERIVSDPDLIGADVLPIAALFAGDLLCLDFREDPADPAVVVWHHEESDEFDPHFVRVAGRLGEFFGMMFLPEDD